MPMNRRRVLRMAGGAAAGLAVPLQRGRAAGEPLPMGALYPFSGGFALLGDESFRGLELAVEERNAAGGVLDRPIRLIKGDAVDPAQAVSEVRRLMGAERVAAVFGTYASPLVFAASQVTELAGTPYFELSAISDPVTERGFRYLFRSCAIASSFGAMSVEAITGALAPLWGVQPRALRIAILSENALYGATVSGYQAARCKELGLNVVETLSYSASTTVDLGSVVQRLRGAEADVVLHTGYQNDIVLFYRQMQQVGWRPRMVVGAGGGYSLTDTANAIGADFEGTTNVDFPPYAVNEQAAPGVGAVQAAYEKKYGTKPRSGHSLANYMGATLFLDAIQRAGSLDKDKLRSAVLATDLPWGSTVTGWGARFDDKGQNVRAKPFVLQWQDGAQLTVFPDAAAVGTLRPTLGR